MLLRPAARGPMASGRSWGSLPLALRGSRRDLKGQLPQVPACRFISGSKTATPVCPSASIHGWIRHRSWRLPSCGSTLSSSDCSVLILRADGARWCRSSRRQLRPTRFDTNRPCLRRSPVRPFRSATRGWTRHPAGRGGGPRRRALGHSAQGQRPDTVFRDGDGRAALGPVLREYLISEAMASLGVPTTRSLAVVTTGEPVYRETVLPGAILTRVAASHIRVGTFQYFAARDDVGAVRLLADYTIARHVPEARERDARYDALLRSVVARQADLVAQWLLIGFVHGVMNTDNTTVSGETIDYGPCAFLDAYDRRQYSARSTTLAPTPTGTSRLLPIGTSPALPKPCCPCWRQTPTPRSNSRRRR